MFHFLRKKHKWVGEVPDQKLWRNFKKIITFKDDNLILKCIDLNDLRSFARNELFNLSLHNYTITLNKYGSTQTIQPVTAHGESLLNLMHSTGYQYEHMQVIILTKSARRFESKIIKGFKNRVSNTSQILELILDGRNQLEREGHTISSISILHTHPSLEVIAVNDHGTQVNFQALSPADLKMLKQIQAHFQWPIQLCAITPSAVQYTCTREDISDC